MTLVVTHHHSIEAVRGVLLWAGQKRADIELHVEKNIGP